MASDDPASSLISTGLMNPNRSMLFAICVALIGMQGCYREIFKGRVGRCKTRRTVAEMRRDSALLRAVDRKGGDQLSRFFGWFMLRM